MPSKAKNNSDAKALEEIEKQQKSQAKRAEQAHKDVREYVRKKARTKKADGGMVNKKLTKTVPPKKGPNSQGMRGTGSAIRGTKFKGVF